MKLYKFFQQLCSFLEFNNATFTSDERQVNSGLDTDRGFRFKVTTHFGAKWPF